MTRTVLIRCGTLVPLLTAAMLVAKPANQPIFGPVKLDFSDRIWAAQPAPPDAQPEPHHARIVDYGDDWSHFRLDQYLSKGRITAKAVDLDGDGQKNDIVTGIEFSLDIPFLGWNQRDGFQERVDWEANHICIYGGRTYEIQGYNRTYFMEGGGPNMDHSSGADDLNFMLDSPGHTQPLRGCGLWLWKKQDFYGQGNRHRVSFDNTSLIALHAPRHWTAGYGRFVVQNGDQWYISEFTFKGKCQTHQVRPAETRWARYQPKAPWDIRFEAKDAVFEKRTFSDIRIVGYYLATDTFEVYATNNGIKLGAFEVDAVVHKPARASDQLAMVKVPATEIKLGEQTKAVAPFYMATCPIPYTFHQKITRWSCSDCSVHGLGYIYDRTGDMGSMRKLDPDRQPLTHQPDEPVTGMTWLDAVAWCNALSEFESRTPVYYCDPEFKTVFRIPLERRLRREFLTQWKPKVHVKWDAPGFRLPTVGEWLAAWQQGDASSQTTRPRFAAPVGSLKPDKLGLYDMSSLVWHWIWDAGDMYDPETDGFAERHIVLGGDANDPMQNSASPWGHDPLRGGYNIGFRPVRNLDGQAGQADKNLALNSGVDLAGERYGTPSWTFAAGERSASRGKADTDTELMFMLDVIDLPAGSYVRQIRDVSVDTHISALSMSRCEIPFDAWERVRRWAVMHGYRFSHDGDMGSMWYRSQRDTHSTDEPVTRISWWDTLAWCNALSEMQNRRPCYYEDKALQKALRCVPLAWRFHDSGYASHYDKTFTEKWEAKMGPGKDSLHVDWSADGYRLPTKAEWQYAAQADATGRFYWGAKPDMDHFWARENSGCRTMPVGKRKPNPWGLHDVFGNVMEWSWSYANDDSDVSRNPKNGCAGAWTSVLGGGFLHPSRSGMFGISWNMGEITRPILAYPEIGFRVVRCDKAPVIVIDGVKYTVVGDLLERVAAFKDKQVKVRGVRNEQLGTIQVTVIEEVQP